MLIEIWLESDNELFYLARQNAENSFVEIHDRIVSSFIFVHGRVCVKSYDEKISESLRLFQKVEMADVK